MDEIKQETAVGNKSLESNDELRIVEYLKKNLPMVNASSLPVTPRHSFYTEYSKRFLDIVISAAALIVTLPINAVLAVCTYFDVGSPIIFKQERIGKDGKHFVLIKFRNMTNATDENGKLLPPSQRVTKFGKFVRKCSLDELLNFWSIFKGDMSVIGPRPMPTVMAERMSERHKLRHAVKPGLECPRHFPQKDIDISAYQYQFESDVWYVENISLKTDAKMLFDLFGMVFSFRKRSRAARVSSYFVGYDDRGYATSFKKYKDKLSQKAEEDTI